MTNNAEQTAQSAEGSHTWDPPGYCLQWSRLRADIPSKYPDATTAWKNATGKHPGDRNPPRGAAVYWTGGSQGYGHICISVGGGRVRSTDAGGAGNVATVPLDWFERNWGLPYAGWADSINQVTIPGVHHTGTGDDVELSDSIALWSPEDNPGGQTTVGKTLNQARGYAEDAYRRVVDVEKKVDQILKLLQNQ
jgi:hypothetical protein